MGTSTAFLSHQLRSTMLVDTLLIVLLLSALFVVLLRRWVTQPLQQALALTELFASGDFRSVNGDLLSRAPADEVEQIVQGIHHMAHSLRGLLEQIDRSSKSISAAAEQMNFTAEGIAFSAGEVASQAEVVATASEEMSSTSTGIARNCHHAAENSSEASEAATTGTDIVLTSLSGMERIEQRVLAAAKTLDELGASSEQIGDIISTIEDIADQTNLLALNAAIEAARAGDQGRGFAVVADEVRALADRTTSATREIGAMILAIQQGTQDAVAAMEEGVHEVAKGTALSLEVGKALEAVLFKVCDVTSEVSEIANAAEQQTSTTSEITFSIQLISEVMQETVRGATEAANASTGLVQSANELKSLAGKFQL